MLVISGVTNQNKMAAKFSGALQLTSLDDFITPSQVEMILLYCICIQDVLVNVHIRE